MRYVFLIMLLLALCACKTTSPQVQTSETVTAPEAYNSCIKIYGVAELAQQQTPDPATAVDRAMSMCSSQYTTMRKTYAKKVRGSGYKPTSISDGLYDRKAKKEIREYYTDYFTKLIKGE